MASAGSYETYTDIPDSGARYVPNASPEVTKRRAMLGIRNVPISALCDYRHECV